MSHCPPQLPLATVRCLKYYNEVPFYNQLVLFKTKIVSTAPPNEIMWCQLERLKLIITVCLDYMDYCIGFFGYSNSKDLFFTKNKILKSRWKLLCPVTCENLWFIQTNQLQNTKPNHLYHLPIYFLILLHTSLSCPFTSLELSSIWIPSDLPHSFHLAAVWSAVRWYPYC